MAKIVDPDFRKENSGSISSTQIQEHWRTACWMIITVIRYFTMTLIWVADLELFYYVTLLPVSYHHSPGHIK
jgi:hypothetical protein